MESSKRFFSVGQTRRRVPAVSSLQSLQTGNLASGDCPNGWLGMVLRDRREKRYNVGLAH
ncbi:hypothetical protein RESH_02720 [Rhodopirellula europaea SH398]|uniref:Uncharacterized protein n=1 Tax=Rhodopirellula europaea SH398 TaxID=1263868 RepID=M5SGK4_9BACT|nr:hypothetical protein RESH_02720 [Rhodopirellula europaea SH398]